MLRHRLLLGPVMLAFVGGALWLDERLDTVPSPQGLRALFPTLGPTFPPGVVLLLVFLLLVPLAARELGAIFHAGGVKASRRWMGCAAAAGLLTVAAVPTGSSGVRAVALVATVATLNLLGALLWHIRGRTLQGATAAAGATMFAFVYLGLMAGFIIALRREHSAWLVLAVLVIPKACDIGAFTTGKLIGRHKLIPWVSPGKTWEGLVGGTLVAAAVATLLLYLGRDVLQLPWPELGMGYPVAAAYGALFGLLGQAGDLLASVLKRDAGIKDSGRTIPGFGGVLDVIDSLLLVAPVAFWLLTV